MERFPLAGRTILLITEQGFGDVMQFVRYAPVLKAQGPRVIFECPEKLIKLVTGCAGVDVLIPQGEPLPAVRRLCAALDGPGPGRHVGRGNSRQGSLHPPRSGPGREVAARARGHPGFKVGINWQGNSSTRATATARFP